MISILPFLSFNSDSFNITSHLQIFNTKNNNSDKMNSDDSSFLKKEVKRLDTTLAATISKIESSNFDIESFKSSQVYIDLMKDIKRFDSVLSSSSTRIESIEMKVNSIGESAFGLKLSNDLKRVDETISKLSAKIDATSIKFEAIPPCDCNDKLTEQHIELSKKYVVSVNDLNDKLDDNSKKVTYIGDEIQNLKVDNSKACSDCLKKDDVNSMISPSIAKIDDISNDIAGLKKIDLKDARVDELILNLYLLLLFLFIY